MRSKECVFKVGKYGKKTTLFERIDSVEKVKTDKYEEYLAFMQSVDILIVFADKQKYFYRHSGTVMEAIANGVIPIVPNYPILASQVNIPLPVGLTYESLEELYQLVNEALSMAESFRTNRLSYFEKRQKVELLERMI